MQGGAIGHIDDTARISFPALGAEQAAFLGAITTLEAFRVAAAKQTAVLPWQDEPVY